MWSEQDSEDSVADQMCACSESSPKEFTSQGVVLPVAICN